MPEVDLDVFTELKKENDMYYLIKDNRIKVRYVVAGLEGFWGMPIGVAVGWYEKINGQEYGMEIKYRFSDEKSFNLDNYIRICQESMEETRKEVTYVST